MAGLQNTGSGLFKALSEKTKTLVKKDRGPVPVKKTKKSGVLHLGTISDHISAAVKV